MLRKFFYFTLFALIQMPLMAQNFDANFTDQTLRLDYIFAGTNKTQAIYFERMSVKPHWAGRRSHMAELPLHGNGQVTVRNVDDNTIIYRTSFSSLFQEWINTPEAALVPRSFQNSFLIPMPQHKVSVEVTLFDAYHKPVTTITHQVDPTDVLIRKNKTKQIADFAYMHKSGSYDECIDVAILSEGYDNKERELFYNDAQIATEAMLAHVPFSTYANSFNIVAVFMPSIESGVSVPRNDDWRQTAFGSHYSTFYSDRYLTSPNVFAIHDALSQVDYEHIIVLANTPEYGGGGIYNSYTLTSSRHSTFKPVLVHEFGHSFGGLADEYCYAEETDTLTYPSTIEPWEPNITTKVDFAQKWENMLDDDGVSLIEGAGYSCKKVYRSAPDCRMRTNECKSFCKVCTEALIKLIRFYTDK